MRATVIAILALSVFAARASEMSLAVSHAMRTVCQVNRDSRQCEILQDLYADQTEVERGAAQAPEPHVAPEVKAEIRKAIKREAPQLDEAAAGFMLIEARALRSYKRQQGIQ
jgi:hypothetical protein